MTHRAQCKILVPALLIFLAGQLRAQDEERAIDHARQVLELLQQGSFDHVAAEFNAQMAADVSPEDLAALWVDLRDQFGEFQ